jgi:hypothetical protein
MPTGVDGWRGVFVGTLVGIILSPLSLAVSYYMNRIFARPQLSVQYVTPRVEIAPLIVDKNLFTAWQRLQMGTQPLSPDFSIMQCNSEFQSGSISMDCVRRLQGAIQASFNLNKSIEKDFIDVVAIISRWDGKRNDIPKLLPIELPNFDLETAIRNDQKEDVLAILKDNASAADDWITQLGPLVSQLSSYNSASSNPRSGNVSFKVGILNSGDSDAVIFPDATLSFQDSHAALRPTPSAPGVITGFPQTPFSQLPPVNVVRSHSFTEVSLVIDDTVTQPNVQYAWRDLVINAIQQGFSINLISSSKKPLSGSSRLPPRGKE